MPDDIYAMCATCGWEDDHPKREPDVDGGINGYSLNEARRLFEARGWIFSGSFAWIEHGCPPAEDGPRYEFTICPCCDRETMEVSMLNSCFTCDWTSEACSDEEASNVLHGETDKPIELPEARALFRKRGWVFMDSYTWELHGCPDPRREGKTCP